MVNDTYRFYWPKIPNQNFRNFSVNGKQPIFPYFLSRQMKKLKWMNGISQRVIGVTATIGKFRAKTRSFSLGEDNQDQPIGRLDFRRLPGPVFDLWAHFPEQRLVIEPNPLGDYIRLKPFLFVFADLCVSRFLQPRLSIRESELVS